MQVIYSPLTRNSPMSNNQTQMYYKNDISGLDFSQQNAINFPAPYEKRSITPNRDRPAFSQISHKNALHLNSGSKRRQNNSYHNFEQTTPIDISKSPIIGANYYQPVNTAPYIFQSPLLYSDHLNPTFKNITLSSNNTIPSGYTLDSGIHSIPTPILPPLNPSTTSSNIEFINANNKLMSGGVEIMKGSGIPLMDPQSRINTELEKKFSSTEKLLKRVDDLLERSYANSSRKTDSFLENSNGTGTNQIKISSPSTRGPYYNPYPEANAYHKRAVSNIDSTVNSEFIFKKAGELLEETFRAGFETSRSNSPIPDKSILTQQIPRNLSPLNRELPIEANLPPKFNNPSSMPVLLSPARVVPIVDPLKQNERVRALDMPLRTLTTTSSAKIVEKSSENPYPNLTAINKRKEFEVDSRKAFQILNSQPENIKEEQLPGQIPEEKLKLKNISTTNPDRGSPSQVGTQIQGFESNNTPKFEAQTFLLHSFRENSQRKEGTTPFVDSNEPKLKQLAEKIQFVEKGIGFELTRFIEEMFLLALNKNEKNFVLEKKTVEQILEEFKKDSVDQKQSAISFIRGGQYTPSPGDKLSLDESAPNNAAGETRGSMSSSRNSIELLLKEGLARLREEKEAASKQELKNSSAGRMSVDNRPSLKSSLEIKKLLEGSKIRSSAKQEDLLENSNLLRSGRIGGSAGREDGEEEELNEENNRESIVIRRSSDLVDFIQNKLGSYKDPDSQESAKNMSNILNSSAKHEVSGFQDVSPETRFNKIDDKSASADNGKDITDELSILYEKVLKQASGEKRPSDHRSFASYIKEHGKITEFKTQDPLCDLAEEKENKGVPETKKLARNSDVLVSFAAGSFNNNNQNAFEKTEMDVKFMLGGIYNRLLENMEN